MGRKIIIVLLCVTCMFTLVGCDFGKGKESTTELSTSDINKPAKELKLEFDSKAKIEEAFPDNGDNNAKLAGMTDIFINTINDVVMKIDYKYEYASKSEGFKVDGDKAKVLYQIGRKTDYIGKSFFNNDKISNIESQLTIDKSGTTDMYFSVTFKDMKNKEKMQLTERDKDLLKSLWEQVNIDSIQEAIDKSYEKEDEKNNGIVDIPVTSGHDKVTISVYPVVSSGMREISVIIYMSM